MARPGCPPPAAPQATRKIRPLRVFLPFVLVCAAACSPQQPRTSAEHVVLTPTADPAESQTVSWRTGDATTAPILEIAPRGDTEDVTRVDGTHIGTEDAADDAAWARATDLEPDTEYQYRVSSENNGFSDWHHFTTASADEKPFTFLYFGDVQNDITTEAAPVVRAGLEAQPDAELLVHAGDMVDDAGSTAEWEEWYTAYGSETLAGKNQVAAVGNHEYDGDLSPSWRTRFPTAGNGPDSGADLSETVYYTDYQGVRFVTLNSNYRDAPEDEAEWLNEQDAWLDSVLTDNPHDWTVVTLHHPLLPNRSGRDNPELRDAWLETLEEHDVDLVLQGHDHSYGRGNLLANRTDDPEVQTGPVYVVAVAGSKMYDVSDDLWAENDAEARVQRADTQTYQAVTVTAEALEFSARTEDGAVIDEFQILREGEDKRVVDNE